MYRDREEAAAGGGERGHGGVALRRTGDDQGAPGGMRSEDTVVVQQVDTRGVTSTANLSISSRGSRSRGKFRVRSLGRR